MTVTVECPREDCEWTEEVTGTDALVHYCPSCAPDRRVKTTVNRSTVTPDTLADKL